MAESKTEKLKDPVGRNIHQRIAAITAEVKAIEKTGRNQEQDYAFMEYDAVTAALRELMLKHGITVLQNLPKDARHETEVKNKWNKVGYRLIMDYVFTVTNMDDPKDNIVFDWQGESIDYGDKGTNKAATAAEKYFLLKLFKIGSKDDPDRESPEIANNSAKSAPAPQAPTNAQSTSRPAVGTSTPPEGDRPKAGEPATKQQKELVFQLLTKRGINKAEMTTILDLDYGIRDASSMTKAEAKLLIERLMREAKSRPGAQQ